MKCNFMYYIQFRTAKNIFFEIKKKFPDWTISGRYMIL